MFRYEHVGEEIKGWARAIAIITFIPYAIAAVVVFVAFMSLGSRGGPGVLLAFITSPIIVLVGYVIARLSGMLLYGFGELVDKTTRTEARLTRLEKRAGNIAAANVVTPATVNGAASSARLHSATVMHSANPVKPIVVDALRIKCPNCQTLQMNDREICCDCGTPFHKA